MWQFFINPAMLLGLAGLSLPIIAHLLSKKKYDVVEWGAMQFLELNQATKRKIRLEEILLLLVRMALIALIAFALSRPWAYSSFFGQVRSGQKRDVVFIIDGSYSMGWEGKASTPHEEAQKLARRFLRELNPGDTVGLIDARNQVHAVIASPTRNFRQVREAIDDLPEPAGTSHMSEAIHKAITMLSSTSNLSKEIVILTDGQALGWEPEDTILWQRINDQRIQSDPAPRIWIVDVGTDDANTSPNFYIDPVQLSREVTVPDLPVIVRSKVHQSGGKDSVTRSVHLEVNGTRIEASRQVIPIEQNGEVTVEFQHTFHTTGSHIVSLVLDDDQLPGDNRSDAAVLISPPPPVLIIDGDPQLDPAKRESHFLQKALTPTLNPNPWVKAKTIAWDRWKREDLQDLEVVVLANVKSLTETQSDWLTEYVVEGGGLFITMGDRIEPENYKAKLWRSGEGLLPALPVARSRAPEPQGDQNDAEKDEITIAESSLELPWIEQFKREEGGDWSESRFDEWWNVSVPLGRKTANLSEQGGGVSRGVKVGTSLVIARLTDHSPLLVSRSVGRGSVMLLSSSIDADWNTMVSKQDYVPLVHEIIFMLAATKQHRNVDTGTPLFLHLKSEDDSNRYVVIDPQEKSHSPEIGGTEISPFLRWSETHLPGKYRIEPKENPTREEQHHYVVNSSREESDLTPLTNPQKETLAEAERMQFVENLKELKTEMFAEDSRSELWPFLLLSFLAILVVEVWMTRRLVQGGHVADTADAHHHSQISKEFLDEPDFI